MGFFFQRKLRHALFGGGSGCSRLGCNDGGAAAPDAGAQRRSWIVRRVSDKLRLNAEQTPLLGALVTQMAELRQALRGDTSDPRAEVRSWFAGSRFDAARAQRLLDDKASTLQRQSPALLAALAAFFDSLNPLQQQALRDWMEGGRRGWFRRHCRA